MLTEWKLSIQVMRALEEIVATTVCVAWVAAGATSASAETTAQVRLDFVLTLTISLHSEPGSPLRSQAVSRAEPQTETIKRMNILGHSAWNACNRAVCYFHGFELRVCKDLLTTRTQTTCSCLCAKSL